MIYFVERESDHAVKIGFTFGPLKKRMYSLKSVCKQSLRAIGTMPGGLSVEKWLHRKFSSLRLEGEWFLRDESLEQFITTELEPWVEEKRCLTTRHPTTLVSIRVRADYREAIAVLATEAGDPDVKAMITRLIAKEAKRLKMPAPPPR